VPPSKRTSSVLNDDHGDLPEEANRVTNPEDALAAAEEAEAEAAEADAQAAAARARARAIRLRRQAAAAAAATVEAPVAEPTVEAPVAVTTEAPVVDEPTVEAPVPVLAAADVAPDDTELDEPTEEYPDEPSRWSRRPRLSGRVLKAVAVVVVIVASIAFVGLTVTMYVQHRHAEAQRQQTAEFSAAAGQGAVILMSMNFETAKDDVKRIVDNTTGDFHKSFQDEADNFVKVAQSSKVVIQATVTSVGIQKITKDTATALVTVTTRVSNMASDKQDPRAWRLVIELARDGGQIKMSKVEFVP
jgi:Mce-associated membrane protein